MNFLYISDLHLEFGPCKSYDGIDNPGVDGVILAGDIGVGQQGIAWAEHTFKNWDVPVFYLCGNHEYYSDKWSLKKLNAKLASTDRTNVKFMQNTSYEFVDQNVVILGCTLWTDFELFGSKELAKTIAMHYMNDYRCSYYDDNKPLIADDVENENTLSKTWLREEIERYKNCGYKVVVVTHHAPFAHSCNLNPRYAGDFSNTFFANSLSYDFPLPDVWIHGHVHHQCKYEIGNCAVLCNPRGYPHEGVSWDPFATFRV